MNEDEFEEGVTPEIVETNQLAVLVKESGLEQSKANFMLESFSDHYKMAAEWAKKAKAIIVTDESQTVNMEMARTGRLFLRKKRLEIENARKVLKEQSLREGKAIDMIANFLKDLIIPTEEHLSRQEYFVENKKKAEDERILAEAHAKAEEERLKKEKEDAEKVAVLQVELNKAKEEKEKAEAELRAKQQAEARAEADRIREETLLKNSGDSVKLGKLKESLEAIRESLPEVKESESKVIIGEIKGYLNMAIGKIKPVVVEEE